MGPNVVVQQGLENLALKLHGEHLGSCTWV
jgi:hypothetical protein